MSDYEMHRGKLEVFPRQKNEDDKSYLKRLVKELGKDFNEEVWENNVDDYDNTIYGYLDSESFYDKVFYIKETFYINKVHEKLDPYDDIQEMKGNNLTGYTYLMRFYNGGTCLEEMIEEALEKNK